MSDQHELVFEKVTVTVKHLAEPMGAVRVLHLEMQTGAVTEIR